MTFILVAIKYQIYEHIPVIKAVQGAVYLHPAAKYRGLTSRLLQDQKGLELRIDTLNRQALANQSAKV
jgi:hypothetical protein